LIAEPRAGRGSEVEKYAMAARTGAVEQSMADIDEPCTRLAKPGTKGTAVRITLIVGDQTGSITEVKAISQVLLGGEWFQLEAVRDHGIRLPKGSAALQ
jgi:hypothetical protein